MFAKARCLLPHHTVSPSSVMWTGLAHRCHGREALSRHTDALQIRWFMIVGKKNLYYRKLWLLSLLAIGSIDFCFVLFCVCGFVF